MKVNSETPLSAVMLPWPQVKPEYMNPELVRDFDVLLAVKEAVNQALEEPRSNGRIGSSLEAQILLKPEQPEVKAALTNVDQDELSVLFITSSGVNIIDAEPDFSGEAWHATASGGGAFVYAIPAKGVKCIRCWRFETTVGRMPGQPEICERCFQAVQVLGGC